MTWYHCCLIVVAVAGDQKHSAKIFSHNPLRQNWSNLCDGMIHQFILQNRIHNTCKPSSNQKKTWCFLQFQLHFCRDSTCPATATFLQVGHTVFRLNPPTGKWWPWHPLLFQSTWHIIHIARITKIWLRYGYESNLGTKWIASHPISGPAHFFFLPRALCWAPRLLGTGSKGAPSRVAGSEHWRSPKIQSP